MHSIDYENTDKEITAWSGLRLVEELMARIDFHGMLDEAGLPERGSNRAYDSSTDIEGFIVSVILAAKRLVHSGTIRKIFGWKGGMALANHLLPFPHHRQYETVGSNANDNTLKLRAIKNKKL